MLNFSLDPDNIFTEIVTRMLENAIGLLELDITENFYNFTETFFENKLVNAYGGGLKGSALIKKELEKLLKAHQSKELYMPTDRHFQLLDRVLRVFCDLYTDGLNDPLYYKNEPIKKLQAGELMDIFFWDNDYDFPEETAKHLVSNKSLRKNMDISNEAIGASLHLLVDSSDLQLQKCDKEDSEKEVDGSEDMSWLWLNKDIEE